jgi:predicted dehydrogenase
VTGDAPHVLVVGAGSIGARHARNLLAAGATVDLVDPLPDRAKSVSGASPRASLEAALADRYDGIIIASPTSSHVEHATQALASNARVLVEKPLAIEPEHADKLAAISGDRLCVAYNLRFHPPVERFMAIALGGELGPLSAVRLWFGSWLPDWRPTIDYRTTYSAKRRLGGGVLLDAIHELDLLLWLCDGEDLEVLGSLVARLGPLEIDVEDTVKALLRTAAGSTAVELSLDYLSRTYRRGIEVIGTSGTARLDWSRQVLEVDGPSGTTTQPATKAVDLSYERQTAAFVSWISGGPPLPVSGELGAASVRLAARIRTASA